MGSATCEIPTPVSSRSDPFEEDEEEFGDMCDVNALEEAARSGEAPSTAQAAALTQAAAQIRRLRVMQKGKKGKDKDKDRGAAAAGVRS